MLVVRQGAPIGGALQSVVDRASGAGARVRCSATHLPGYLAFGAVGQDDPLDTPMDPSVDPNAMAQALESAGLSPSTLHPIVDAIAHREEVLFLEPIAQKQPRRPITLFEFDAIQDVLQDYTNLLAVERIEVDRDPLNDGQPNHCIMEGNIARIRLLGTNGSTLAGRTHCLVHEVCHGIIGTLKTRGKVYKGSYGSPDYSAFFGRPEAVVDEEAMVRAIADAWQLRRQAVAWTRTWPGAIDVWGQDLDADDLAAWCRFKLALGLGMETPAPVIVRKIREASVDTASGSAPAADLPSRGATQVNPATQPIATTSSRQSSGSPWAHPVVNGDDDK